MGPDQGVRGEGMQHEYADWQDLPVQKVRIHGYERAFVMTGSGPALLLIHGIGMNHRTWLPVIGQLSKNFTVIAPDLLGHGESDKPRADYSIAGYANAMRDLLLFLDIPSVTVVGHSLGGGVAMQFTYQFPQMVERLVLVSTGGLGRSVNPLIRAMTIPGSGPILALCSLQRIRRIVIPGLERLAATGIPGSHDIHDMIEVYEDMADAHSRAAFRQVLRAGADWRGQFVTMIDRAYLARYIPTMVVWGGRDLVIPVKHAYAAKELLPQARLEVFTNAGHVPHEDYPDRFAAALTEFIMDSPEAQYDHTAFQQVLRAGDRPRRKRVPRPREAKQATEERTTTN